MGGRAVCCWCFVVVCVVCVRYVCVCAVFCVVRDCLSFLLVVVWLLVVVCWCCWLWLCVCESVCSLWLVGGLVGCLGVHVCV